MPLRTNLLLLPGFFPQSHNSLRLCLLVVADVINGILDFLAILIHLHGHKVAVKRTCEDTANNEIKNYESIL